MQIGPKIRVGGTLGKIGEGIKKVAPFAAPFLLPGIGGLATGVMSAIPGASAAGGALSQIPGASAVGGLFKGGGGVGGLLKGAADYAVHNPLDVLGGINSAVDAAHARDLQGKAEGLALDNYNQRAPLRAAGVKGLLNPVVPDLSGINYGSSGSVYGKKRQPATAGGGY